jgi:hypothetical protein
MAPSYYHPLFNQKKKARSPFSALFASATEALCRMEEKSKNHPIITELPW